MDENWVMVYSPHPKPFGEEFMKTITIRTLSILLGLIVLAQLAACGGQPAAGAIETAVAGTIAAMPAGDATQIIEVTKVKEVTRISVIQLTATPRPTATPTQPPTATPPATATLTATPRPSLPGEPTAIVTVSPSGDLNLTLNQLLSQYKAMTDLQKQDYITTLPGKLVSWTAEVDNVTTDGLVELKNLFSGGSVILIGVPAETALELDRKMLVDFKGMIQGMSGKISPEIIVVDVTILRAYNLPTATPTP
jgi:hypothetical protein